MSHALIRKIESILSIGLRLDIIGVDNWALTRSQALAALDKISETDASVLGGDVLSVTGQDIRHNYDNWACDHKIGEAEIEYKKRSIVAARDYIIKYPAGDGDVLFEIVCKTY